MLMLFLPRSILSIVLPSHAIGAAPHLAETLASLGLLKFWLDWDWPAAETAFRDAIRLDSSYGLAHRVLGIVLSQMGQHTAAQSAMRHARELDPMDFVHLAGLPGRSARIVNSDLTSSLAADRLILVDDPDYLLDFELLASRDLRALPSAQGGGQPNLHRRVSRGTRNEHFDEV